MHGPRILCHWCHVYVITYGYRELRKKVTWYMGANVNALIHLTFCDFMLCYLCTLKTQLITFAHHSPLIIFILSLNIFVHYLYYYLIYNLLETFDDIHHSQRIIMHDTQIRNHTQISLKSIC